MNILNNWLFWVIVYLFSAVTFANTFKIVNRKMKDANILTVILEIATAISAIIFIPLFEFKFIIDSKVLFILFIVILLYSVVDRLNTDSRYGLEASTLDRKSVV